MASTKKTEPSVDEGVDYDLEVVERIPMGRWLAIRRHFDLTTEEILSDPSLVLLVAANECKRKAARADDWARFESMTIAELGALFDEIDAAKSDRGGDESGAEGGGARAD